MTLDCRFGFIVRGGVNSPRNLVDWPVAFLAYSQLDPRCALDCESYLSSFTFSAEFRDYLPKMGTTAGFAGPSMLPYMTFDFDYKPDPTRALDWARRLSGSLIERYRALEERHFLTFWSGGKGVHLLVPSTLWGFTPSPSFPPVAKRLAETLAIEARATIDLGIYFHSGLFRAPGSRHPRTGLHKRFLSWEELHGLSLAAVLRLAREPVAFDLPEDPPTDGQAAADFADAVAAVEQEAAERAKGKAEGQAERLCRDTVEFIREPPSDGERHSRLFRAAANLFECGATNGLPDLIRQLLRESALDSGLPPREVERVIKCAIDYVQRQRTGDGQG